MKISNHEKVPILNKVSTVKFWNNGEDIHDDDNDDDGNDAANDNLCKWEKESARRREGLRNSQQMRASSTPIVITRRVFG